MVLVVSSRFEGNLGSRTKSQFGGFIAVCCNSVLQGYCSVLFTVLFILKLLVICCLMIR